ncbi:hypothetical protein KAFR_0C02890 [Kazachstania africana CBS 2517]|uniref:Uncharacterized protein n=1 Tax=Kazachstania africana (strain ATCC 22294 / BCRC 22015 / CBS 2517 / CECT 1963 / NBRC 1671 / NRRL Y-8276) TaxID=1071382 RepID=H2ASD2_KAZAF|nr:hypothetical protein KAFR_0C02890 [Kazachstania africana CBS 2517]CCF57282.1 hypothetical protein KAFR_0C02890 [Kazachstania africana CBS 2517]
MPLLQPTTSCCYHLKLPKLPVELKESKNEAQNLKFQLKCRTGAAQTLKRSNIFVHGGLTIPLNLTTIDSLQLQKALMMYFAKETKNAASFENLKQWISSETFYLDLVSRSWRHIPTTINQDSINETKSNCNSTIECSLNERIYHSMCYSNSSLYIFGGLVVSPTSAYELVPTNELWRLDLTTKEWSLLSKNPKIKGRFNHRVHVKNENVNIRDTKLVIVGGLDDSNRPIYKVDVYNLTQNCWQDDAVPTDPLDIVANIDNEPVSLTIGSNFSIMVENNEAKIPALAFYIPNNQVLSNGSDISEPENKRKSQKVDCHKHEFDSPVVALPLLSNSKGMKMAFSTLQDPDILKEPFNLQFPSGEIFGYNIILSGFYPDCKASNFYCFVYDIPSGKWSRISVACPDNIKQHRFWKLYVWKSHHQALLLGTRDDDGCLPSVQKFDHLLAFGLPLINVFNKLRNPTDNLFKILRTRSTTDSSQSDTIESLQHQQRLIFSDKDINEGNAKSPSFRNASYVSTNSSQFENYIRYIAPPLGLSSIRSIFPDYAMVLGKDALEIFGSPLSDFQLITSEGDSVGIPSHLLRKRWGRYFDYLLSKGYSEVCSDYESLGAQSTLIKLHSHRKRGSKSSSMNSRPSSSASLYNQFSKYAPFSKNGGDNNYTLNTKPSSTSSVLHPYTDSTLSRANSTAELRDTDVNNRDEDKFEDFEPFHTTSSSTGMIFRVPFQDTYDYSKDPMMPLINEKDVNEGRRSSLMGVIREKESEDTLSQEETNIQKRRSSHPTVIQKPQASFSSLGNDDNNINPSPSRYNMSSRSSMSHVSPSSERLPISSRNNSTASFSALTTLNVTLPPQTDIPNEPLPQASHTTYLKKRNSSLNDYLYSNKNSPLSSRRGSYTSAASVPDIKSTSQPQQSSLDKQMMENYGQNGKNGENQQDQGSPKSGKRYSRDEPFTESSNSTWTERSRSIDSNADSVASTSSINPMEMEPLLTPRSLYLPWPTSTVRAFAEFFFTGQVNPKWLLAPIVLDLLVIGKIYEIPLLYSIIVEVLYSIIARKEESLSVICNSMFASFIRSVEGFFCHDQERIQSYLASSACYSELMRLKNSLEQIDNGFLDFDLLRKTSSSYSRSLSSQLSASEVMDKYWLKRFSSGRFSSGGSDYFPTMFTQEPRGSNSSMGPIIFPQSFMETKKSPMARKKSSLSYEIDPKTLGATEGQSIPKNSMGQPIDEEDSRLLHDMNDFVPDSDDSSSDTTDTDGEGEDSNLQNVKESLFLSGRSTSKSKIPEGIASGNPADMNFSTQAILKDKISKPSSLSEFGSGLGTLSINKMKKKIKEGLEHYEESIDPLFKMTHDPQDTSYNGNILSKPDVNNFMLPTKSLKDDSDYSMLTIESMASSNSLPPVDYVIKCTYRTAVLVNDIQLMIRCLDCIEISKGFKAIKAQMENEFLKSGITRKKRESKPL